MGNRILVLGSCNVDFILRVPRFHDPGETIAAKDLITAFGGKGANQAMAAKRLGGQVDLVAKLGGDPLGRSYRRYLVGMGFRSGNLLRDEALPSGVALIEVDPRGENRIIVSPGANGSLGREDVKRLLRLWKAAKLFVTQLEVPIGAVAEGLQAARDFGLITLLNPSPPTRLKRDLLALVDYLVPNEGEAQILSGMKMKNRADLPRMAGRLLERGVKNVIITLGEDGLFFKNREEEVSLAAFPVKAVDTTAAGDSFVGALALGLAEERPIRESLRFAGAAAALSTTRLGAQPSLPERREVERFLRRREKG